MKFSLPIQMPSARIGNSNRVESGQGLELFLTARFFPPGRVAPVRFACLVPGSRLPPDKGMPAISPAHRLDHFGLRADGHW